MKYNAFLSAGQFLTGTGQLVVSGNAAKFIVLAPQRIEPYITTLSWLEEAHSIRGCGYMNMVGTVTEDFLRSLGALPAHSNRFLRGFEYISQEQYHVMAEQLKRRRYSIYLTQDVAGDTIENLEKNMNEPVPKQPKRILELLS